MPASASRPLALLLQKHESIQDGSSESDQFPINKTHGDVPRLQPGSQTMETIAALLREVIVTTSAQDVAPQGRRSETGRWPSLGLSASWAGISSYFKPSLQG